MNIFHECEMQVDKYVPKSLFGLRRLPTDAEDSSRGTHAQNSCLALRLSVF